MVGLERHGVAVDHREDHTIHGVRCSRRGAPCKEHQDSAAQRQDRPKGSTRKGYAGGFPTAAQRPFRSVWRRTPCGCSANRNLTRRAFPRRAGAWSSVIFTPPSMRAISSTRAPASSGSTLDVTCPPLRLLCSPASCWSPCAATCGRWVTHSTWRVSPSLRQLCGRRSRRRAPPMPTSTSSKISVGTPATPAGDHLDRQADARQLAARGHLGQRPRRQAGMRWRPETRRPPGRARAARPAASARLRSGRRPWPAPASPRSPRCPASRPPCCGARRVSSPRPGMRSRAATSLLAARRGRRRQPSSAEPRLELLPAARASPPARTRYLRASACMASMQAARARAGAAGSSSSCR